MDFYKDFPERSDAGTATTPDGGVVAGSDKLNDNDYTMVGANGTGSNSQGKGYKVKFSSIYNYLKSKLLGDSGMEATSERRGLISAAEKNKLSSFARGTKTSASYSEILLVSVPLYRGGVFIVSESSTDGRNSGFGVLLVGGRNSDALVQYVTIGSTHTGSASLATRLFFKYEGSTIKIWGGSQSPNANGLQVTQLSGDVDHVICRQDAKPSDAVEIQQHRFSTITPQSLAASYIAERYSIGEEQALTRRMIANDPTVVEQFNEYNAYCEECKTRAKEELSNKPQVLPADELNNQTI